jgi:hypothetical protein
MVPVCTLSLIVTPITHHGVIASVNGVIEFPGLRETDHVNGVIEGAQGFQSRLFLTTSGPKVLRGG